MRPTKPSTLAEYAALFWAGVLILVGFGVVCLYFGYRAPAEKAEQAAKLIQGGYAMVGGGVVMVIIREFLSRL